MKDWRLLTLVDAVLHPESGLTAVERLVLIALARYRNHATGDMYPCLETLAADTGLNERSVRRALERVQARTMVARGHSVLAGSNHPAVRVTWSQPSRRSVRHYQIELLRSRPKAPARPDTTPALTPDSLSTLRPDTASTLDSSSTDSRPDSVSPEGGLSVTPRPDTKSRDPQSDPQSDPLRGGSAFALTTPKPDRKPKSKTTPKARRRQPEVSLPDDWQPTEKHRAFAANHGLSIELEVVAFRGNAEQHDRRARSWNGAFTTWLAKSVGFAAERKTNGMAKGRAQRTTSIDPQRLIAAAQTLPRGQA